MGVRGVSVVDCWRRIIDYFLPSGKGFLVVYGEAGAGKTSFSLSLARYIGSSFLYINTEGSPVHERALQVLGGLNRGFFLDVHDEWGLLLHLLRVPREVKIVFVDSLNGLYRVEASSDIDTARQLFVFINAILKQLSENGKIVVGTAQVTLTGEEPSGFDIISVYGDNIIRLVRTGEGQVGELLYENRVIGRYRITGDGVRWMDCWI